MNVTSPLVLYALGITVYTTESRAWIIHVHVYASIMLRNDVA